MKDEPEPSPGPSWELGDYRISPVGPEIDEPSEVPWRLIGVLAALGLAVAAVAFLMVIAV